jgi:hypothetical protein
MTTTKQNIASLEIEMEAAINQKDRPTILERGAELLNAETMLASLERDIKAAEEQAANMGKRAGENAAHWVIQDTWGGRVTRGEREAAAVFLEAFDDGDLDSIANPPNLSGEWADSETPASLMESCFGEDWEDCEEFVEAQDNICAAWEIAAQDAFYFTLCQSAESILA